MVHLKCKLADKTMLHDKHVSVSQAQMMVISKSVFCLAVLNGCRELYISKLHITISELHNVASPQDRAAAPALFNLCPNFHNILQAN